MGFSGAPAETESELLSRIPSSNEPGVFPRDLLPPYERVIFETRPGLFALYWGRIIFTGFWFVLLLAVAIAGFPPPVGVWFFVALPGIALLVFVYQWRYYAYALTNLRVLAVSGIWGTSYEEASYASVHNLMLEGGISGGLRFDTSPPAPGFGPAIRSRSRPIHWTGIQNPARVYQFVQEAFAFGLRQQITANALQTALQGFEAGQIQCEYCGGMIDLAGIDPANPRCPQCAAPIRPPR